MKLTAAQREEFRTLFQTVLLEEGVYFPSGDGTVEALYTNLEGWIFDCLAELDEAPE